MSLKRKVYLLVVGVLAVMALVAVTVARYMVFPSFAELERNEAREENEFLTSALEYEARNLRVTCADWACWDDTYQFVRDRNAEYIEANLGSDTMEALRLDLFYICDLAGRRVWSSVRDHLTGLAAALPELPATGLPGSHPLLADRAVEGRFGVWPATRGPMLVAVVPITTSDREGPARGYLIMGRSVTDDFVASLPTCDEVTPTVRGIHDGRWSPEEQAIGRRLSREGGYGLLEIGGHSLAAYRVVQDLADRPALLVQVTIRRNITAHGHAATRSIALSMLVAFLCAVPLTMVLVNRAVVRPISALTDHAVQVAQSGNLSARLNPDRRDEIGVLSRQFDAMLEKLTETRARLLSRSYKSGMEQMAAGALHNVRNALAPAVVRLGEAEKHLRAARPDRLATAVRELARACAEGRRNPDLESYVGLAGVRLFETLGAVEDDLIAASQQIARIERMLPEPDARGRVEPVTEEFTIDTVLPEALTIVPDGLRRVLAVEVEPSLAAAGPVRAVQVTVEQVLAALLTNAAEAGDGNDGKPVRAVLGARLEAENGARMVHLQVSDDGRGMAPEVVDRVFEIGFSTKGGTGLGLHWCANAVHAMGGRMFAESPGAGGGACLHVLLPAGDGTGGPEDA